MVRCCVVVVHDIIELEKIRSITSAIFCRRQSWRHLTEIRQQRMLVEANLLNGNEKIVPLAGESGCLGKFDDGQSVLNEFFDFYPPS